MLPWKLVPEKKVPDPRTRVYHSLMHVETWNPGKTVPGKNGPLEKWSRIKMVPGKVVPGKMVLGKDDAQKIGPRRNGPRKIGPRETHKRKIVGWASSIVVCVCVCVECWDVINLSKPKTWQQTQNSVTNPKLGNKKSWGERRASWCVSVVVCERRGGMFGCDQSMKTQNSTTNLPGLL